MDKHVLLAIFHHRVNFALENLLVRIIWSTGPAMTQYGYGYGYQQPYGYSQVAATPTAGYSAYQQRMPYTSAGQTTQQATQQSIQQPQQQASQHHQPQQPSVGYSPYTASGAASAQQQLQARPATQQQYHQPVQQQQQQPKPAPPPPPPGRCGLMCTCTCVCARAVLSPLSRHIGK